MVPLNQSQPTLIGFTIAVLTVGLIVTIVFGLLDMITNPPPPPLEYTITNTNQGIGVVVNHTVYDRYTVYHDARTQYIRIDNTSLGATLWITADVRGPIPEKTGDMTIIGEYTYPPWLPCNGEPPALTTITTTTTTITYQEQQDQEQEQEIKI